MEIFDKMVARIKKKPRPKVLFINGKMYKSLLCAHKKDKQIRAVFDLITGPELIRNGLIGWLFSVEIRRCDTLNDYEVVEDPLNSETVRIEGKGW